MGKSLKDFKRKVRNRKFAIDHSPKGKLEMKSNEELSKIEIQWESLNQNLIEAEACKNIDGYFPIYSYRKLLGKIIVFSKKAVRKALKITMGWYIFPLYERISFFNGKILNSVSIEKEIIHQLEKCINQLKTENRQLRETVEEYRRNSDNLIKEYINQLKVENKQIKEILEKCKKDSSALMGEIEKESKKRLLTEEKLDSYIKNTYEEILVLGKKLNRIENLPTDNETFYHDFEEKFRGSRELIKERLQIYVPILKEKLQDWSKARFVDIGSGRGEWLDILRENGAIDYIGVDLNAQQNELSEKYGHHTVQMDCIKYLLEQPNSSVDLITGFQIIEHLYMSDLMKLLKESYRVLKPGGVILFETPNPKNLIVGANTFYIDPSHIRPLVPETVSFLVEWCGYSNVKCIDVNSHQNSIKTEVLKWNESKDEMHLLQEFNDIKWNLYGPQDYAVIGTKE